MNKYSGGGAKVPENTALEMNNTLLAL